jgi:hypothetical protein
MRSRSSLSALAAVLVLIISAIWSGPASAAPDPAPDLTIMGVGKANFVSQPRTLYQCPETFCNQGQAYPGNDLARVCDFANAGIVWALVFNRANEHTGFIPVSQLSGESPGQDCSNVGQARPKSYDQPMYQCPYSYCNQGVSQAWADTAGICWHQASGIYWWWSFNHYNLHEGFRTANDTGGLPPC